MDLVFMSTFDNQSMSIGCVCKLAHLFGFLRHYLLISTKAHQSVCTCITVTESQSFDKVKCTGNQSVISNFFPSTEINYTTFPPYFLLKSLLKFVYFSGICKAFVVTRIGMLVYSHTGANSALQNSPI